MNNERKETTLAELIKQISAADITPYDYKSVHIPVNFEKSESLRITDMNKDEMNLKVNIDTKSAFKELKKLQKQLKKTKHLYKEVISLSDQLDELEVKHDENIETVRALTQQAHASERLSNRHDR